ncbi:hypothetical protein DdX_14996 [Ditylenchus destructor]|uniref:Secreted protein n=1 Tax=Ditylenchus destructor TaxID=166010 RepID=A0AAD4R1E1_9BILA|nr:hypothetical protein DdX_14996 [Ditylenchus destructor]
MGSRCFTTVCIIILSVISIISADKTMLSPPGHQSSDPDGLLNANPSYNLRIADILKALAEKNINTVAETFASGLGNLLRKNETLKPFAGYAEEVTKITLEWLAGVIAQRVYNVTRKFHSSEFIGLAMKKEMESLKEITNKAIDDSKETFKKTVIAAIDKKAELLIEEKSEKWKKILGDDVARKISQIHGFDEALADAVKKVLEETGDDLAKEALLMLKSPEKNKAVGGIIDNAYGAALSAVSGTIRAIGNVARASGERAISRASIITKCLVAVHTQLIEDFVELDKEGIPIHIIV